MPAPAPFAYQGLEDQALDQFAKAESLAPNNADVLILIAWYLPLLNQPVSAVALAERALQLNPHYPNWYNQGLRFTYFFGAGSTSLSNTRSWSRTRSRPTTPISLPQALSPAT